MVTTVSDTPNDGPERKAPARLILTLRGDLPLEPGIDVDISGARSVTIGRGSEVCVESEGGGVVITLPDGRVSTHHAVLERTGANWLARDCESKNGTYVDGRRRLMGQLRDGAVLGVGTSVFLFRRSLRASASFGRIQTHNAELASALGSLVRVATSTLPIVIRGETGTGKELVAQGLHEQSGRSGRFVAVNCGAIPANLVESELFGVRAGAFTGANTDWAGLVLDAAGGTLFLDEVAELPLEAQAALLRVLQEKEVRAVGQARARKVDLRVVAASHQKLDDLVRAGTFREDLYARLRGLEVHLPPLRQRREDLGDLIRSFLAHAERHDGGAKIHPAAARALVGYAWPHNVRELEQAIASAVLLAEGEIRLQDLPAELGELQGETELNAERFREVCRLCNGNVTAVARELSTSRSHVRRLAVRFGFDFGDFR